MAYLILHEGGTGEIEEKKSRFIATIRPVTTEEEARNFVDEMKKQYWDARHNCYAFILGENADIMRFSDDGEPGGTAGKPILEVLSGSGVRNICCVVTRYFGGTLLGTGGLVRAYTDATKAGLDNCVIARRIPGVRMKIRVSYSDIGKVLFFLEERKMKQESSDYAEDVCVEVLISAEVKDRFVKELTEATAGRCELEELGRQEFDEIVL
ncbi:MAG: YigZ family protein [Lachnospiraceae bacterium]|nr:YigZ family protein [Candidatus Merdinaster equi]